MGDSVRLVRGAAYGDAKSSCAPGFSGVRRSAAAPDLVKDTGIWYIKQLCAGFLAHLDQNKMADNLHMAFQKGIVPNLASM